VELDWTPAISDPSALGWLAVACYFAAAALAARAWRVAGLKVSGASRERSFWLVVGLVLCALGINKQLDLQSLLTQAAKIHAIANGWYDDREALQYAFVAGLALAMGLTVAALGFVLWNCHASVKLAAVGLGLTAIFVWMRAAAFHHVEDLLAPSAYGAGRIFEFAGIAITAAGAFWYRLGHRDMP
jgi:heme/copper-type cytochrome/quinol oxidase subunit 4